MGGTLFGSVLTALTSPTPSAPHFDRSSRIIDRESPANLASSRCEVTPHHCTERSSLPTWTSESLSCNAFIASCSALIYNTNEFKRSHHCHDDQKFTHQKGVGVICRWSPWTGFMGLSLSAILHDIRVCELKKQGIALNNISSAAQITRSLSPCHVVASRTRDCDGVQMLPSWTPMWRLTLNDSIKDDIVVKCSPSWCITCSTFNLPSSWPYAMWRFIGSSSAAAQQLAAP